MFGQKFSEILRTLIPKDQEELALLRSVLHCAQDLHSRASADFSLAAGDTAAMALPSMGGSDLKGIILQIPEEARQYLYSLAEALDIYQSIKGRKLPIQNISLSDQSVYELKQIRDMCLQDGLRSIY